ncbi:hypothetical protein [Burkholderia pseudomallei]|uniref:hypothetical protein n=1 Tax=Burkholderia pseudomallei TaxID=28450 RepID=UPI000537368F|nr:hypothetical protein [Burkholderia pseudomallei]KGW44011.1 hypothetical protein Y597_5851 [Burkholderia pseudomallei MSHR1000]
MTDKLTAEQIEFAKAAGFYWHPVQKCLCTRHSSGAWVAIDDMLARFVALLSARPAESWQVEIDAYKREVRELEAMLRISDDAGGAHLKTTLSPDQRVSMAAKLLGFANELLNGIDKS